MESHLKHCSQLCKSCDRKISARRPGKSGWSRFRLQTKPRPSAIFSQPTLTCSGTDVLTPLWPYLSRFLSKYSGSGLILTAFNRAIIVSILVITATVTSHTEASCAQGVNVTLIAPTLTLCHGLMVINFVTGTYVI